MEKLNKFMMVFFGVIALTAAILAIITKKWNLFFLVWICLSLSYVAYIDCRDGSQL